MPHRHKIRINGIVQGVGFRPFVYRLANECSIAGFVNNIGSGVWVEAEGEQKDLNTFRDRIKKEIPPLAVITEFNFEETAPLGETGFIIKSSEHGRKATAFISPDVGVCEDCLSELFDPKDRRYRYPFLNCTNCGPRFTIVHGIPYDRSNTSMQVFPLCHECHEEYRDPKNRRFHAQPNACPKCGPSLSLHYGNGKKVETGDPIGELVSFLRKGKIVALRGIGGFHLVVDAQNDDAVRELRRRKGRAEKPFALMAPDLEFIRKFCLISEEERKTLCHHIRPIVLLRARPDHALAPSIAMGHNRLGFMLPYTPLHYLLLRGNFEALVMTSGNFSEEPIAMGNNEAMERLAKLADIFLLHDREILQRCDDSIAGISTCGPQILRRSRGYVPAPVLLASPIRKQILACGGELKNCVALARGNAVFLSPHIGDLDNPSAFAFFKNSIGHLQKLLEITPEVIAHDLHPEYLSTKWALEQKNIPLVGVQHHHAHLASVMAENGVEEKSIGIILDGSGYGTDGTIWGGEVLVGDYENFERFAWIKPTALPGGEAAIRQPWRMALSYLHAVYERNFLDMDLPFLRSRTQEEIMVIVQMMERGLNSPLTSSCGRLFDAISAVLDIRCEINYEAQAAMELEATMDESEKDIYLEIKQLEVEAGALPIQFLFRAVVEDMLRGEEREKIATRFHLSLGEIFLKAALKAREFCGVNRVGLSGGVFQNIFFFNYLYGRLLEEGFQVLTHHQVPTNDGGLALGQAVIANAKASLKSF